MKPKTTASPSPSHRFAACLTLAACAAFAAAAAEAPSRDIPAAVKRLQDQLDEQTRRIDRLYRALGPRLEEMEERAAYIQKQRQEDKALALEQIAEVQDESLTAVGCVNPAAAEFAVITSHGSVRLFDAAGKPARDLHQPGQVISCLAFAPNGAALLTGTATGALLVWDLAKGTCRTVGDDVARKVDRVTWLGNNRVVWGGSVEYWKDGKAVNHDQPAGAVLDLATAQRRWTFRAFIRDDFHTLAGAHDGSRLAVLEIPGQPRGAFLLEGATGEVRHVCYDAAHGSGPLSAALSPDGSLLAVGYAPRDIILWNARTGERGTLLEGHQNWVVSLAFSTDSTRLISGAGDSTARLWDLKRGREIGRIRFEGSSTYVEGVGLSPRDDVAFAVASGVLIVARVDRAKP
ncbi:MAG: hypothetical protein JXQ71_00990 [Verrucomicrobia bacterium]|nr:hypothetical protein [Verrucomicrobiota bacterium]